MRIQRYSIEFGKFGNRGFIIDGGMRTIKGIAIGLPLKMAIDPCYER